MTVKEQNKINAAYAIRSAAVLYKKNLVGKQFLYYFDGRYIEVIYKSENFKHMTGADSTLSANTFYQLAADGKLTDKQIAFNHQHPYSLARKKLQHLISIASLATAEGFILEEITTQTKTYKFGATNLEFTLCFNQKVVNNIIAEEGIYHVESLRHGDSFSKSKNIYDVLAILYKSNDSSLYSNIAFLDDTFEFSALPEDIRKMCSEDLIQKLSIPEK